MTGDDAYEFLIEYSKLFNVDISIFKFSEYFGGEGLDFIGYILQQLNIKKRKIRRDLTIEDQIRGIEYGCLDDDILSKP